MKCRPRLTLNYRIAGESEDYNINEGDYIVECLHPSCGVTLIAMSPEDFNKNYEVVEEPPAPDPDIYSVMWAKTSEKSYTWVTRNYFEKENKVNMFESVQFNNPDPAHDVQAVAEYLYRQKPKYLLFDWGSGVYKNELLVRELLRLGWKTAGVYPVMFTNGQLFDVSEKLNPENVIRINRKDSLKVLGADLGPSATLVLINIRGDIGTGWSGKELERQISDCMEPGKELPTGYDSILGAAMVNTFRRYGLDWLKSMEQPHHEYNTF